MWRHLPILTLLVALLVSTRVYAEKGPTLLVFTANWCASCRDVLPSVKAYAAGKGYAVQVVDVDTPAAQGVARQYGLGINQVSPPMVFFVSGGRQVLVLDEKSAQGNTAGLLDQKAK